MQIRIIREEMAATCKPERHISTIEGSEFIVGRGARSALVLAGRRVSLEHARITMAEGVLAIEDLGSMSGVQVDGEAVRQRVLKAGDVVQIGEFTLYVERDGDWLSLRYEIPSVPRSSELSAEHLSPARLAAKFWLLGGAACTAVILWAGVGPLVGREAPQSAGRLSAPHHNLSGSCVSCHSESFRFVQDASCKECHELSRHPPHIREVLDGRTTTEPACSDCHFEHNGGTPVLTDAKLCVSCHADITRVAPKSEIRSVPSWGRHPEFSITLAGGARAQLGTPQARDVSHIKLNHDVHLKPDIRGAQGFVTLQCNDCHEVAADGGRMQPVRFENHCQSCHTLVFDERLPDSQVPHGDPDAVFRHAYAEYAKLFLEAQKREESNGRRRPGEPAPAAPEISFVKSSVVAEARKAEEQIFTKTACQLCHTTREKPSYESLASRFEVEKPLLTKQFFVGADFKHIAHESVRCQSCHEGVAKSTATEDVLLPKIATCQECHGTGKEQNKVASPCVQCHSYHDQRSIPTERKKQRIH